MQQFNDIHFDHQFYAFIVVIFIIIAIVGCTCRVRRPVYNASYPIWYGY